MCNPQGILWSHPQHLGFPLWRLTICCRACCISSRAALDSLRIHIYSSCWNTCGILLYVFHPEVRAERVFSLILSELSVGCQRDAFMRMLVKYLGVHTLHGEPQHVLGSALTTFSLFSLTVTHSAWTHC